MESKELVDKCIEICDNHKAENIVVFDVREKSTIADYYLFCSGNSDIHIGALAGSLEKELKRDFELKARAVEGTPASRWVLVDFSDVLVHIFHPQTRKHYAIERLHRDSPVIHPDDYQVPAAASDAAAEEDVAAATGDQRPDFLQ